MLLNYHIMVFKRCPIIDLVLVLVLGLEGLVLVLGCLVLVLVGLVLGLEGQVLVNITGTC